ncbi:MAG: cadherin-like domain-containing protein [Candidatus Sedimenticola sp. PURPLELP]
MADNTNNTGNQENAAQDEAVFTLTLRIPDSSQLDAVVFTQDPRNPGNLVATLPGGEEQVYADYLVLAQAGLPPALSLADGTVIDGNEVIGLIDNLDFDLLATAAGAGAQNGNGAGAGYNQYSNEGLGDDLGHDGFSGDPGQGDGGDGAATPNAAEVTSGFFTASVVTGDFLFGFEDGLENAHLGDPTFTPMQVLIEFFLGASTFVQSVDIAGIPEGATVFLYDADHPQFDDPQFDPADADAYPTGGSLTLIYPAGSGAAAFSDLFKVFVQPPADSDEDFEFDISAVLVGPSGILPITADPVPAFVDGVADMPVVEKGDEATILDQSDFDPSIVPSSNVADSGTDEPGGQNADGRNLLDIGITATFDDVTDGSEHHMLLARVPDGWEVMNQTDMVEGQDGETIFNAPFVGTFTVDGETLIVDGTVYDKTLEGLSQIAADLGVTVNDLTGAIGTLDGEAAADQGIGVPAGDLADGVYALFYMTADNMTANGDPATSPTYTANVTLTLEAPDRWDMEQDAAGNWVVTGGDIGFVAEDPDGAGGNDSGVMIGDTGVVEFNIPTYALSVDVPTEPETEPTYTNNLSLVEAGTVEVAVDPVHGQMTMADGVQGFEDGDSGDRRKVEAPEQDAENMPRNWDDAIIAEGKIDLGTTYSVPDNEQITQIIVEGVLSNASLVFPKKLFTVAEQQQADGTTTYTLTAKEPINEADFGKIDLFVKLAKDSDDDRDMDVTLHTTFMDPETGHTLVRTGDVHVTVDAVAEKAAVVTDGTFTYAEDHAAPVPDAQFEEPANDADPAHSSYGIGFAASSNDHDGQVVGTTAVGSEGITKITINPKKGADDISAFEAAGKLHLALDGTVIEDGADVAVRAVYGNENPDGSVTWVDGTVIAKAAIANGTLTLTFEDPNIRVQSVDLNPAGKDTGLEVRLPQHSDNDAIFNVKVWTEENPTDGEAQYDDAGTPATPDNNTAVKSFNLHLDVEAVADPVTFTAPKLTTFYEDAGVKKAQGAEKGDGTQIALDLQAHLVDTDGSEAVSQVVIQLAGGVDPAAKFVNGKGKDLVDGNVIKFNGVKYEVTVDVQAQTLTLDLISVNKALGDDLVINGKIQVELPHDDSSNFSVNYSVTTKELDNEGAVAAGGETYTTQTSVDYTVLGVVAEADTALSATNDKKAGKDDGAQKFWDGSVDNNAESFTGVKVVHLFEDGERKTSGHDGEGVRVVDFSYIAKTQDLDGSEGIASITLAMRAPDKQVDQDGNPDLPAGSWFAKIGTAPGPVTTLIDPVSPDTAATFDVNGATGTYGLDANGNLVIRFDDPDMVDAIPDLGAMVGIALPVDDSTDFLLSITTKTVEFDDDRPADINEFNPALNTTEVTDHLFFNVHGVMDPMSVIAGRDITFNEDDTFNGTDTNIPADQTDVNGDATAGDLAPAETVPVHGTITVTDTDGSENVEDFGIFLTGVPDGTQLVFGGKTLVAKDTADLLAGETNTVTVTGYHYGANGQIDTNPNNAVQVTATVDLLNSGPDGLVFLVDSASYGVDQVVLGGEIDVQLPQHWSGNFEILVDSIGVEDDDNSGVTSTRWSEDLVGDTTNVTINAVSDKPYDVSITVTNEVFDTATQQMVELLWDKDGQGTAFDPEAVFSSTITTAEMANGVSGSNPSDYTMGKVHVEASFSDVADGSENHEVVVEIPVGFLPFLSLGGSVLFNNAADPFGGATVTYLVARGDSDFSADIQILANPTAADDMEQVEFTVKATATDSMNGVPVAASSTTASDFAHLGVREGVEIIEGGDAQNGVQVEDLDVSIPLEFNLLDSPTTGTESITSVIISGIPDGATIYDASIPANTWTNNGSNEVDVEGWDYASLKLDLPLHDDGDFTLQVDVTTVESMTGLSRTDSESYFIVMDANAGTQAADGVLNETDLNTIDPAVILPNGGMIVGVTNEQPDAQNTTVTLQVQAKFGDATDTNEAHYLMFKAPGTEGEWTIDGVSGAVRDASVDNTLSGFIGFKVTNPDVNWDTFTVTLSGPARTGWDEQFELQVKARSEDGVFDSDDPTKDNNVSESAAKSLLFYLDSVPEGVDGVEGTVDEAGLATIGSGVGNTNTTLSGNLYTNDINGAVDFGSDAAGAEVTSVDYGGNSYTDGGTFDDDLVDGTITINTGHSILTVTAATGDYTYELTAPVDQTTPDAYQRYWQEGGNVRAPVQDDTESDIFTYHFEDGDGDVAQADLTVTITDDGPAALWTNPADIAELGAVIDGQLNFVEGADGSSVVSVAAPGGLIDPETGSMSPLQSGGVNVISKVIGNMVIGTREGTTEVVYTLGVNADGSYIFSQVRSIDHTDAGEVGAADPARLSFKYTVQDGDGDQSFAYLGVDITDSGPTASWTTPVNGIDMAELGAVSGQLNFTEGEDGASVVAVNAVGNVRDTDDGDVMIGFTSGGPSSPVTSQSSVDGNGVITVTGTRSDGNNGVETVYTLVVQPGGSYAFNQLLPIDHPDTGETGAADPVRLMFNFTVRDGDGDTAAARLAIDIADGGPVARNDTVTTVAEDFDPASNNQVVFNVMDNDAQGADGAVLMTGTPQIINVQNTTSPTVDPVLVSALANGEVTVELPEHFNGTFDLSYTIIDGDGDTSSATASYQVTAVNDAPVAVDDGTPPGAPIATQEDTPLSIDPADLLANDSDVDGDTPFVEAVDGSKVDLLDGANQKVGEVTFTADASNTVTGISVSSDKHWSGEAHFDYDISDGNGGSDSATVTVQVTPVADKPKLTVKLGEAQVASNSVNVFNHDFEAPNGWVAAGGFWDREINGWDITPLQNAAGANIAGEHEIRGLLPHEASNGHMIWFNSHATVSQELAGSSLDATKSYVLQVDIGDRAGGLDASNYRISLSVDGQVIGSVDNADYPVVDGDFITATLTVNAATVDPALLGKPLEIVLENQAHVAQVDMDNVRLTAFDNSVSIPLNITASLRDTSEVLSVEVEGMPAGALLSGGTFNVTSGAWELTPAQLAGLTMSAVPVGSSFQLKVTAISTESDNTTASKVVTTNISVGTHDLDALSGTNKVDVMYGLTGDDELSGGGKNDILHGGEGDDTLIGGNGNADVGVFEQAWQKYAFDLNASDEVTVSDRAGSEGMDTVSGDVEILRFANGDFRLLEGANGVDDTLTGSNKSDLLIGGDGNDTLSGGNGADVLVGGMGDDTLTGGGKSDAFVMSSMTDGDDTITDFAINGANADTVNLDALFDSLGVTAAHRTSLLADDTSAGSDVTVNGGGAYNLTGDWSTNTNGHLEFSLTDNNPGGQSVSLTFEGHTEAELAALNNQIISDES